MNVYEAAATRRSIRRFKNKAVPYDSLVRCVDAARLAPCGRNRQICEYIIVDDEGLLPRVYASLKRWAGLPAEVGGPQPGRRPKAYFVILVNKPLREQLGGDEKRTNIDIGLAAESIMLVAMGEGLGTCPFLSFKQSELREVLNISEKYDIGMVLAAGYPDETPIVETSGDPARFELDSRGVMHVAKRKLEDILHRNQLPQ